MNHRNRKEVDTMNKKLFLAGAVGIMMIGAIPAFAATNADAPAIHQTSNTAQHTREQIPEPPKDADGNPLPPPNWQQGQDGNQPPEPPKDANGNPLPPPNQQGNIQADQ